MRNIVWTLVVLMTLMILGSAVGKPAMAQEGEFELPPGVTWDQVNKIAKQMYCDVCEGVPLDECESVACRQWREEIARQLNAGRNENEIIDSFVEQYGADVAALPRNKTDKFLVFAVPAGVVMVLGVFGAFQAWRLRQRGHQVGPVVRRSTQQLLTRPVPDDVEPYELEQLERELEGID